MYSSTMIFQTCLYVLQYGEKAFIKIVLGDQSNNHTEPCIKFQ